MKNFDIYDRIARIEPMGFSGSENTGDFIYEYDKGGGRGEMMKIIVNDDDYIIERSGSVYTTLYVDIDGYFFPHKYWADLTLPVLEYWSWYCMRARYAENHRFKLIFMTGPFWLDVFKDEDDNVTIECKNDRHLTLQTEAVTKMSYKEFVALVYKAYKDLAKIEYKNNMHKGEFAHIYDYTLRTIREMKEFLEEIS